MNWETIAWLLLFLVMIVVGVSFVRKHIGS
jgi:hypothetical protein